MELRLSVASLFLAALCAYSLLIGLLFYFKYDIHLHICFCYLVTLGFT